MLSIPAFSEDVAVLLERLDGARESLDLRGTQWAPFVEWSLKNDTFEGNPFDVVATASFTHTDSGAAHTTEMFFRST